MARSLPKVCPFLVTVDLKLKWPELPRGLNYPALPYLVHGSHMGWSLDSAVGKPIRGWN